MAPALRRSKRLRGANPPSDEANEPALIKRQNRGKTNANKSRSQRDASAVSRVLSIPELLHLMLEFCPTSTIRNALRVNRFWHAAAICFRYRECSDRIFTCLASEEAKFAAATVQTYDWARSDLFLSRFAFPKLERLKLSLKNMYRVEFRKLAAHQARTSPLLNSLILCGQCWLQTFDVPDDCEEFVEGLRIILKDRKYKIRELRICDRGDWSTLDISPLLSTKDGWDALKVLEGEFRLSEMDKIVELGVCLTELSVHIDRVNLRLVTRLRHLPLQHLALKGSSGYLESSPFQSLHSGALQILTLEFNSRDFSDGVITKMVQGLPNIQKLQLSVQNCRCSIAAVNAIGKHCPRLRDLTLPRGHYNLDSLTGHFHLLESLDLRIGRMSIDSKASIRTIATRVRRLMPVLKHFEVCPEHGLCSRRDQDPLPIFLLRTLIKDPKADAVYLNILPPKTLRATAAPYAIPVSTILSIIEERKALPKGAPSFIMTGVPAYCMCGSDSIYEYFSEFDV